MISSALYRLRPCMHLASDLSAITCWIPLRWAPFVRSYNKLELQENWKYIDNVIHTYTHIYIPIHTTVILHFTSCALLYSLLWNNLHNYEKDSLSLALLFSHQISFYFSILNGNSSLPFVVQTDHSTGNVHHIQQVHKSGESPTYVRSSIWIDHTLLLPAVCAFEVGYSRRQKILSKYWYNLRRRDSKSCLCRFWIIWKLRATLHSTVVDLENNRGWFIIIHRESK